MAGILAPLLADPSFEGRGFLTPPELRSQSDTRVLMLAQYDLDQYHDNHFAHYGLTRPGFLDRAVPKRRAEFLAGRVLAGCALALFGVKNGAVGRGAQGNPLWPLGFRGSISHSHGTVGVWLGRAQIDLGLDIEAYADPRATRAIRQSVLTKGDLAVLGAEPDSATCTAVFSAKEALFKALFPRVGRVFGFDHAEVITQHAEGLTLRLTKPLPPDLVVGQTFDIGVQCDDTKVISRCEIPI